MVTPLIKHKIVKKRTKSFNKYQSDRFKRLQNVRIAKLGEAVVVKIIHVSTRRLKRARLHCQLPRSRRSFEPMRGLQTLNQHPGCKPYEPAASGTGKSCERTNKACLEIETDCIYFRNADVMETPEGY